MKIQKISKLSLKWKYQLSKNSPTQEKINLESGKTYSANAIWYSKDVLVNGTLKNTKWKRNINNFVQLFTN